MRCKAARKLMSRYLDDELPPGAMSAVQEHLVGCDECRGEHDAQLVLWGLLERVPPVEPPDLFASIERRLEAPTREPAPFAWLNLRSAALAVAAAALIGLSIWMGIWAGETRHHTAVAAHDGELSELFSDVPPGFEVVALLERIGE
jgi:anti-sigma factor RsiW